MIASRPATRPPAARTIARPSPSVDARLQLDDVRGAGVRPGRACRRAPPRRSEERDQAPREARAGTGRDMCGTSVVLTRRFVLASGWSVSATRSDSRRDVTSRVGSTSRAGLPNLSAGLPKAVTCVEPSGRIDDVLDCRQPATIPRADRSSGMTHPRMRRQSRRTRAGSRPSQPVVPLRRGAARPRLVALPSPTVRGTPPLAEPELPWWAIAVGWVVAEACVVHLQFRRSAHSFSLADVPFVFGLVFASGDGVPGRRADRRRHRLRVPPAAAGQAGLQPRAARAGRRASRS